MLVFARSCVRNVFILLSYALRVIQNATKST